MTPQSDHQARGDEKFGELQTTYPVVQTGSFSTVESYVLYLFHRKAYEHAAEIAGGRSLLDWGCRPPQPSKLDAFKPYLHEVRFTGTRAQQIEPLYLQLLSEQLEFMRKQMERLKKQTATGPESPIVDNST